MPPAAAESPPDPVPLRPRAALPAGDLLISTDPFEDLDPAQIVKVLPRHLAGPGPADVRTAWPFPLDDDWELLQSDGGVAYATSPCLRLWGHFVPEPDTRGEGAWTTGLNRVPFGQTAWQITFDAATPVELLHDVHAELLDLYLDDAYSDREWLSQDGTAPQRTGDRQVLYEGGPGGPVRLAVDQAVRPDGAVVAYPHVDVPDSVRVLAVHRGRIPLVRQHIYLHDAVLQDLPGGLVDPGESPQAAARRELAEETGVSAAWMHLLGTVVTARSSCTESVHLFLAHALKSTAPAPEPGEDVTTRWSRWHELVTPAGIAGVPADASSLAAALYTDALFRRSFDTPAADAPLASAVRAAQGAVRRRQPGCDNHLLLCCLDLVLADLPEGLPVVREADEIRRRRGWNAAWLQTESRLAALAD